MVRDLLNELGFDHAKAGVVDAGQCFERILFLAAGSPNCPLPAVRRAC
jgi:hypothetical protein